ncbi:MAG: ThuA domain-containing protein [Yonghaparkia sp.]|nr:ThuA domain-containing protein [Microcella sp.]
MPATADPANRAAGAPLRVTVWNENRHENYPDSLTARLYPTGMHGAIAAGLTSLLGDAVSVRTATLDEPEHGLPQSVVDDTDVLLWWGHEAHPEVDDAVVDRLYDAVLGGMGIIVLHSGHYSKIFKKLMGTTCSLRWRNDGDREVVWTVDPTHPIAAGVPDPLVIEAQEMYGEFFDIPTPEELIFISSFSGGEVFRSGCTWTRGHGRVFYFSPGDQEYPVYNDPSIHRVLANGVQWAAPTRRGPAIDATFHARGWFDSAQ